MRENLTNNPETVPGAHYRGRRWWFAGAAFLLVVGIPVIIGVLRHPRDEITRRAAEIFDAVKREERGQGRLADWTRGLPGPLATLGEWLFPQTQKGAYEFADELSKLGSNAAPILIERLAKDHSPMVREVSAMTLGHFAIASALPTLTNALASDEAFIVRGAAVDAIGEIDDLAALPAILQAMRADTNEVVRASAVEAAAKLGGAAVVSDLLAVGWLESDWHVRASLAQALTEVADLRAIPLFAAWLDMQSTNNASLSSGNSFSIGFRPYQADQIIEAVGELGGESAYQLLTNYWSTKEGKESRESLCRAFGSLSDSRSLPFLLEAVSEGGEARATAVEALGQLGDTNALPVLLELVEAVDPDVRRNAFTAVGRLGDDSAVPILIKALESEGNYEQRAQICEALGQIGNPIALEPMLEVVSSLQNNREQVLWALGHLGHTNAIPALTSVLHSPGREESFAAAYALAEIGGADAARALAANLAHKDEYTRHAKACALAMLGRTNGLATIQQSLVAREVWRRFGATLALARLEVPADAVEWKPICEDRDAYLRRLGQEAAAGRVVPALVELLKSPKREYRQYAARGLLFFRDPATVPALREACRDRNEEVRAAAELAVNFIERVERVQE